MRAENWERKLSNPVLPPNGAMLNDFPTFNAQVPPEGPKVVSVLADFSKSPAYDFNTTLTQASGSQRAVSGVYVDNSANSHEVQIVVSVINQVLKVPANSQAYLTLFVPKNATITVSDPSGAATVAVPFMFVNFPLANAVWGGLT